MSLFGYLSEGVLGSGGRLLNAEQHIDRVARALLAQAVDPALVEIMSEHLARTAKELEGIDLEIPGHEVRSGLAHLALPAVLQELFAFLPQVTSVTLAALALHLVDVAERMAVLMILPELPAMDAKADHTGGAARSAGQARHLKA